jgi:hypothetical protein
MKKQLALATATLVAVFVAAPVARASIVNPLTFNAAMNPALAVDPTLAPPANDGTHDFAVGGFEGELMEHVGFSAQSGPQGQAPSGHVSLTYANGLKGRWRVTCLAVEGKDAVMGIVPTEAPPSNAAFEGLLAVHDGGPGAAGDTYAFFELPPSICALAVGHLTTFEVPIMRGDILVHDN